MSTQDLINRFHGHVQSGWGRIFKEFSQLIGIPSVSAKNQSISECADFLKNLLESYGFTVSFLESPTGRPAVYAEKKSGPSSILLYNHYDVQPPEPLEEWETDPFQLVEQNGLFFGRGVSDNKGEIIARLAAVDCVEKVLGKLPVTVKWLIEGEEEVGSPGIPEIVSRNKNLFRGVMGCMWEGGDIDRNGPNIYLGVKGMLYVELAIRTAKADAHSMYAPIIENAAEKILKIIRMIKDERGRVKVPGFYESVARPTSAEKKLMKGLRKSSGEYAQSLGVKRLTVESSQVVEKLVYEPTCNIAGLYSGYTGPGSKTIVPSTATVKIDFRLVPNQDPLKILKSLKRILPREVDVKVYTVSYPARTSPDNPLVKAAVEAAAQVYGKRPSVLPNMAGTGPLYHFVKAGIPTAMLSALAHPGSKLHAPNENIYREHFIQSILHHALIFTKVGGRA
ncbi:MAG: M20/M25/M40 family metallo-hydrolase [Candidatus Caldarchaeum sp.]